MAAHRERVSNVDTAWLRMDYPTNLMMIVGVLPFSQPLDPNRPLDRPIELGNHFGLVSLPLPVGVADVVEPVAAVKRRMQELKASPEAAALYDLPRASALAAAAA